MSDSISIIDSKPTILDVLPNLPISGQRCAIRLQQQLDLMLLAIEALDLEATTHIIETVTELGLEEIINNRITLWRLRCSNPWRRSYTRSVLTVQQAKALAIIISHRAKYLSVSIRQLLLAEQQMRNKGLPVDNNFLISEYLERFRSHFRSRMNPRRAKVMVCLAIEDELNELALALLNQLLFCTGTTGMQRFWISLFDGEVA
ncbi:DUF3038 domain-containing protein [Gloeothece verrucosa]|uniref:DUF3038 domain-containing protein n=1 Tax=Gloeothece verrucosa (strain PCC 7822) TaxID=497965 RepID=E0U9Z8_GLOV7|nr:DUF3038 domain-containing protein [Gloeothece verrucosa]ADN16190.1 conserved hypothetical protein [Gloeothece verrucosa PCC 7822]